MLCFFYRVAAVVVIFGVRNFFLYVYLFTYLWIICRVLGITLGVVWVLEGNMYVLRFKNIEI